MDSNNFQQQPQQGYQQQPQQQGYPQQGYPQQGYPQPGYPQPGFPQAPKKSAGLAIASMVTGICSLVFSCCIPYLPFFLALIAVILGGVSLSKHAGGKGMAIAGLVCGIISLIPAIFVLVAGASLMATLGL